MKKILIMVLLAGMFAGVSHYEHNYTRENCRVVEASSTGAVFKDECGWTWEVKGGNYKIGDVADLKMFDSLTGSYIKDDVIKEVVMR